MKQVSINTDYRPMVFTVRENSPSDEIVIQEMFDENVYRLHDNFFIEKGVVLDVGANIGAFTLNVLLRAKNNGKPIQVFAIEPEPHNIELLKKNLDQNEWVFGDSTVTIVTTAIHSKSGDATIDDSHGSSRLSFSEDSDETKVHTISLDDFMDIYGIYAVSFAKFDIEGSEVPVLLSASDETLDKIKRTAIEFDDHNGLDKFAELVNRFGRNCQINTLGVPARGCYVYTERFDV